MTSEPTNRTTPIAAGPPVVRRWRLPVFTVGAAVLVATVLLPGLPVSGAQNQPDPSDDGAEASEGLPQLFDALSKPELEELDQIAAQLRDPETQDLGVSNLAFYDWRAVAVLQRIKETDAVGNAEWQAGLDAGIAEVEGRMHKVAEAYSLPGMQLNHVERVLILEATVATREVGATPDLLAGSAAAERSRIFTIGGLPSDVDSMLDEWYVRETARASQPRFVGDWLPYDGGTLTVRVRWQTSAGIQTRRMEEWLVSGGEAMPDTGFARLPMTLTDDAEPVADQSGAVINLRTIPGSLLTNPWPASREADHYRLREGLPPVGTRVHIVLAEQPDRQRDEQRSGYQAAWDEWKPERQQILAERGLPDTSDDVRVPESTGSANQSELAQYEFPPIAPPIPEEAVEQFDAWIEILSDETALPERREEAREALSQLDSRYSPLLAEAREDFLFNRNVREAIEAVRLEVAGRSFVQDGIQYWDGLALDEEAGVIVADAWVAPFDTSMPLEFMICGPRGKKHESVFVMRPTGRNLELALERLNLTPSTNVPRGEGDWQLYDGDTVIIESAWMTRPAAETELPEISTSRELPDSVRVRRIEELVREGAGASSTIMSPTGWVYVGSPVNDEGRYVSDMLGSVVSAYQRGEYAILENPWFEAAVPHYYYVETDRVPQANWPVRLYFRVEPAEERQERREQLEEVWDEVRFERPEVSFDAGDVWTADWQRNAYRYFHPEGWSLAIHPTRSRRHWDVTDDFQAFVRQAVESLAGRDSIESMTPMTFDGLPALQVDYRRNGFLARQVVVIAPRFYYVVYLIPPDESTTAEQVDTFLAEHAERISLGWPEDRALLEELQRQAEELAPEDGE